MQGPAVAVELHRPAAHPRPTAGVVELGRVHPLPRRAELPRPDVLGQRSARLGVGSNSPQLQSAMDACKTTVRRWTGRVTGNGRLEAEQLIASADGAEGNVHQGRRLGAAGPVTRKTWVLAGAAVLVAVIVTGVAVVTARCEASDLGHNTSSRRTPRRWKSGNSRPWSRWMEP